MLLRLLPLPLFFAATAWACLNTPGTDLDGRDAGSHYSHDSSHLRQRMQTPPELERRAQPVKPPDTAAKKLEAEALDLIYAGNYAAARVLLQKAETLAPDDYSIAANLGTACELLGDDAEALRWITEAVRRNPDSHRGTEWVHILVLKAKLRDTGSPRATFPPLIDVPERVTPETPLRIDGVTRKAADVRDALAYQLHERMLFVKPRDRFVADLLFSLARLNANLVNIESASGILALAETYGYSDATRAGALRDDIARAHLKSELRTAAFWTLGLGALTAGLVFAHRRKWFFLSRKAYLAHQAATRVET